MGEGTAASSPCAETSTVGSSAVPEINPQVLAWTFVKEKFVSVVGIRGFITCLHVGDFLAHVPSPSLKMCWLCPLPAVPELP